jgi:hypothetical protein
LNAPFGWARARFGSRRLRAAFELFFLSAALLPILPLFSARYLPIQDLPQHVAAVRVIADYGSPELGFTRFFERSLGSTQYLSVYLLAALLAQGVHVVFAIKLVIAGSMLALPYALRAVLRQLKKPESYALLCLPLAYNAHLILGFLNFLAALPLFLWGIAACLRARARFDRRAFAVLASLALACFYTHVVPYGMLVLASVALLAPSLSSLPSARASAGPLLAFGPSFLAAGVWLLQNPAGRAVAELAHGGDDAGPRPEFPTTAQALRDLPEWFTDVFHGPDDDRAFVLWILVVSTLFLAGVALTRPVDRALGARRVRFGYLAPLAFLGYWILPSSYGFIWPIHARFPLLALLLAIPALPRLGRGPRLALGAGTFLLTAFTTRAAWVAFRNADTYEYRGLSTIVARVPEGSRVAGLIFKRASRFVRFSPYLHAVAWIQAERGGAVEFTFAEFPPSPFRFRPDNRPPPVPPHWEWQPHRVDPAADLGWFDYVMTRGAQQLEGFSNVAHSGEWALWKRTPGATE